MKPVLVPYASTHGHTAKIATRIAEDYDYTDWDAVWRFGGEVAGMVGTPTAVP